MRGLAIDPHVKLVEVVREPHEPMGSALAGSSAAALMFHRLIGNCDRERFQVAHLDGKHRVTSVETVAIGTLTSALVHPREVFKGAILANAAAIVVAHNHPSGDVSPSVEDRKVACRLLEAGDLLGIPCLDFLIVGPDEAEYWSSSQEAEAHAAEMP